MNKKFTDLFIKRPVLATVISLLIFFIGVRALMDLSVRQFPKLENTMITVSTAYPGASSKIIEGFITTLLETAIAGADGIDYMTSTSTEGVSTINVYVKLNYPPNDAFTNVMAKVAQEQGFLPRESQAPVITKQTGNTVALMYIGFNSSQMTSEQITDYITRVIQPKLETISGVSQAEILGGNKFAMRIWLNPKRMAALGVTPTEVRDALLRNNFQSAAGRTKGEFIAIPINASTDLESVKGFADLVVKHNKQGALVRVKDVAQVELGSEQYESTVVMNGKKAVFVAIKATPQANPLQVIDEIKKILPDIKKIYPPTLESKVVYDSTTYIRSSMNEVIKTLGEATIIVILIIFLFLGSIRTVTIPIVTIPLSLIGVCGIMLMLDYSLNLLTLLSMVLAIGMVVDDAIVVVENCYRHIEQGMTPFDAAIKGAREIATPVISMTITLAAVYAPIGFMGGLTGALFTEFAFTLAAAVIVSGVIALTLSPMMCSRLLTADIGELKMVKFADRNFARLKTIYERILRSVLVARPVVVMFAFVVLVSCAFLYLNTKKEMAPVEDQSAVFVQAAGPQDASLNYTETFTQLFNEIYNIPAMADYFIVNGDGELNHVISAVLLKSWDKRKATQGEVNQEIQAKFNKIAGLQVQSFPLPPLPTNGSPIPIQFELVSTQPLSQIYTIAEQLKADALKSGKFLFIDSEVKFNKPEMEIEIERSKAAQLGIAMSDIGDNLAVSLGGNFINWFSIMGRSYKVIPQVADQFRRNPYQIEQIYIRTQSNKMVPLATVANINFTTQPNIVSHFQQLNSIQLDGMMMPGYTLASGLDFLIDKSKQIMPHGMSYDFAGQSRQYMQEGSALIYTFVFSIIMIFLVLAAQFESFRDPLVVMTSVPMAICGALLPLNWGLATINIYTQIGLITLIGLISKHGILMVEFANQLQRDDTTMTRHEAIVQAAAIRLRPVLMTTAAMILGVVPLLLAVGAGAHSRFDIGLVISSGMAIGTCFTLFVVPTMYLLKPRSILLFLAVVAAAVMVLYYLLYVIF